MNVLSKTPLLSLFLVALLLALDGSAEQKLGKTSNCKVNKTSVAPPAITTSSSWPSSPIATSSTVNSYHSVEHNNPKSQFVPQVSFASSTVSVYTSFSSVSLSRSVVSSSTSLSLSSSVSFPPSPVSGATSPSPSPSTGGNAALIPNGIKAGVAGGYALPWLNSSLGTSS